MSSLILVGYCSISWTSSPSTTGFVLTDSYGLLGAPAASTSIGVREIERETKGGRQKQKRESQSNNWGMKDKKKEIAKDK